MSKLMKTYLLAFLFSLAFVKAAGAAETKFTNVRVLGTLAVVGPVTAGTVNCSNVSTTSLTAASLTVTTGVTSSSGTFTGGLVNISTTTTSNDRLCIAGAFVTLPTTGYNRGCLAVQTSDMKLYISTETVAVSGSWKSVGSQ